MPLQESPESAADRLRRFIEDLCGNRSLGSSQIADRLLRYLAAYARLVGPQADRNLISATAQTVARAHPLMAILAHVAREVTALGDDPGGAGSRDLPAGLQRLRESLIVMRWQVASEGARHLSRTATILTLSHSGSVVAVFRELKARRSNVVAVVCQSEPGGEGRLLARALDQLGIRVDLIPDAEMGMHIQHGATVLLGCDAVSSRGFINKVGSRAASRLADQAGRLVFVLAEPAKIVRSHHDLEALAALSAEAGEGGNRDPEPVLFEYTPWLRCHRILTPDCLVPDAPGSFSLYR